MTTGTRAGAVAVEAPQGRQRGPVRRIPAAVTVELGLAFIEPLLREFRAALNADTVTVAVRHDGRERLLVCSADDTVDEVTGSLSLGLVSNGPTKLAGAAGLVQAVESSCLFGFTPAGYCGARFRRRRDRITGGVAAWTRRQRRWDAAARECVRRLALLCEAELDAAASTLG